MKDILIPLGLLTFILLFGYVIVHTARQQQRAKETLFSGFASQNNLCYDKTDVGSARAFATGFDGVGTFYSPSLGDVIPEHVVTGSWQGKPAMLFLHSTRFSEGGAREWYVAGITSVDQLTSRCTLQIGKKPVDKQSVYLTLPVVKRYSSGPTEVLVRLSDPTSAGFFLDERFLDALISLAEKLPYSIELQIVDSRLALYPADRNQDLKQPEQLHLLLDTASAIEALIRKWQ